MPEITAVSFQKAEMESYRDLVSAAPYPLRARLGLTAETCGDALVVRSTGIQSVLFNRAIGLGLGGEARPDQVADLVRRLQGVPRYFVHLDPAARPRDLSRWLEDHGLTRYHRSWVRMVRGPGPIPEVRTDLRIRRASVRHAAAFGWILARGFAFPEEAASLVLRVIGRPRWHPFVALDGEVPVAAAALFIEGDVGYLAFAATHPAHRRRGAQGALMARRIQVALALGCRHVITETGESVPGDPQHSYRNMLRAGFVPQGLRHNYGRFS